jgi:hypothetical protein
MSRMTMVVDGITVLPHSMLGWVLRVAESSLAYNEHRIFMEAMHYKASVFHDLLSIRGVNAPKIAWWDMRIEEILGDLRRAYSSWRSPFAVHVTISGGTVSTILHVV